MAGGTNSVHPHLLGMPPEHVLLILVDGLGIPREPTQASIYAQCPALRSLLEQHCAPVDAGLGVDGLPQSATGQATILTGINAAEKLGMHLHGFPNAELRELIEKENLFGKLIDAGRTCTFANAYALQSERTATLTPKSVTTVATLAALGPGRTRENMLEGHAVYHDLTRCWLAARSDEHVPLIDEKTAARHLMAVVRTVDFCLFEFFMTDVLGHRGTQTEKRDVLASLDRFLAELLDLLDREKELLLLISDHGNIEEPGHRKHTANPVPFCAVGYRASIALDRMQDLTDVTPRILNLLSGNRTIQRSSASNRKAN